MTLEELIAELQALIDQYSDGTEPTEEDAARMAELTDEINQRRAAGEQAAQTRAGELQTSFSHTRPSGASCFTALTEAGVSYTRAGENIAYGQSTPEAVVQSWMNSSGHRANLLSSSFTTIGVGYTVVNGTAYWAQLFTA